MPVTLIVTVLLKILDFVFGKFKASEETKKRAYEWVQKLQSPRVPNHYDNVQKAKDELKKRNALK